MKRIKLLISSLVLIAGFSLLVPAPASAQLFNDVCNESTSDATVCQENEKEQTTSSNSIYGPDGILSKAVGLLSVIIGVAAIIMIIVGGLRYVLSSGDANNVKNAQNTILFALVGLVIALTAQALIRLVINKL